MAKRKPKVWDPFGDACAAVAHAMSDDPDRVNLCGIHVEREPGGVVASDGHRLAFVPLAPELLPEGVEWVTPLRTRASVRIDDGRASRVPGSKTWLRGPMPEGLVYPDWRRFLPQAAPKLTARLASVEAFARSLILPQKLSGRAAAFVRLDFEPGTVRWTWRDPNVGEGTWAFDATTQGEAGPIGFNARYLRDALDFGGPFATLEVRDVVSPLVVRRPDAGFALVMPARL